MNRAQRVNVQGKAKIAVETARELRAQSDSKRAACATGYGNEQLIDNFKIRIMRGDRIGLIGSNGVGKIHPAENPARPMTEAR